jgi:hydroxymethylglutaryl-CoA reductase
MPKSSRLPGFYDQPQPERARLVAEWADLSGEELNALSGEAGLDADQADHMIENAVGVYGLPLGIAANFVVNGREVLVPMAIEEPSVVAGASFMAKLAREGGGFRASADQPEMIGQIQVMDVGDLEAARQAILAEKETLLETAARTDRLLVELGGGPRDIQVRALPDTSAGPMLIVHLVQDCRDAMGANTVNTACEALAPKIEALTGGRVVLRILSNLADRRLARAEVTIPAHALAFRGHPGKTVARGIVEAYAFAAADPYRAATHNKGIMNGVDAVVIATGNDWRAIEAGAHAYAARCGRYTSLSVWEQDRNGDLIGRLEMPMAVGIVGGNTRAHPAARVALKILGVQTASQLAEIIVSVGLAQNLAALRALATEGIQKGHMALHARQIAIAAGASGAQIEHVARQLVEEGQIRLERAQQIIEGT